MTWIEEAEIDVITAIVYSDHNKLIEFHSSPGNGLPSDVVFFALVVKNIDMVEFLLADLKYEWSQLLCQLSQELHRRRENEDKRYSTGGKR